LEVSWAKEVKEMGLADVINAASGLSPSEQLDLARHILLRSGEDAVEAHATGFVLYAGDVVDTAACVSPVTLPGINLLSARLLGIVYFVAMLYCFLGIAIVSDLFMGAIEVITSKERTAHAVSGGVTATYTYKVWNPSVANLTLMALGSSAPEILLAIIGTVQTLDAEPDLLGPSTIVGSAAFNLLIISAICVNALPDGEVRRIKDVGVFFLTTFFSVLAYIWLYLVLRVISPGRVEIWEAVVTFALFPVMVVMSYGQDVGWRWCARGSRARTVPAAIGAPASVQEGGTSGSGDGGGSGTALATGTEAPAPHAEGSFSLHLRARGGRSSRARAKTARVISVGLSRPAEVVADDLSDDGSPAANEGGAGRNRSLTPADIDEVERLLSALALARADGGDPAGGIGAGSGFDGAESPAQRRTSDPAPVNPLSVKNSFRQEAIRSLIGKRHLTRTTSMRSRESGAAAQGRESQSLESSYAEPRGHRDFVVHPSSSRFQFTHRTFACSLAWGQADVGVQREGGVDAREEVAWRTLEPPSAHSACFKASSGVLVFEPGQDTAVAVVKLLGPQAAERRTFQVRLDAPVPGATGVRLGRRGIATVVVAGSAEAQPERGRLRFRNPRLAFSESAGTVRVCVERVGGHHGAAAARVGCKEGTAVLGLDFTLPPDPVVLLAPFEVARYVDVSLLDSGRASPELRFALALEPVPVGGQDAIAQAAALDADAAVCNITIVDDSSWKERMARLTASTRARLSAVLYSADSWADQLREAVVLSGGMDEETGEEAAPTPFESVMHAVSIFWKVIFAFVPPTGYGGGWPAFFVSLLFIGVTTFVTGEFAKLFGCVVGIPDSVTAISIVALGTSLPDTFASRTAALNDDSADAAIGNVTGSNSVNVFLGLGLPWLIGSLYHAYAQTGQGTYDVPALGLGYSILLFTICAVLALSLLMARRRYVGGELGGSLAVARLSSAVLTSLWLLYILLASLGLLGVIPADF